MCFCDNEIDIKGYNPEAMVEVIFIGICKLLDVSIKYEEDNPKEKVKDGGIRFQSP